MSVLESFFFTNSIGRLIVGYSKTAHVSLSCHLKWLLMVGSWAAKLAPISNNPNRFFFLILLFAHFLRFTRKLALISISLWQQYQKPIWLIKSNISYSSRFDRAVFDFVAINMIFWPIYRNFFIVRLSLRSKPDTTTFAIIGCVSKIVALIIHFEFIDTANSIDWFSMHWLVHRALRFPCFCFQHLFYLFLR